MVADDAARTRLVKTLHAIAMRDVERAAAWARAWRPELYPPYRLRLPRPSELEGVPQARQRHADDPPPLVVEWVHRLEVAGGQDDPEVTSVWASTIWAHPDENLFLDDVVMRPDAALYAPFQSEDVPP